ncbi:MAG: hypothetical protein GY814_00985 [Gammaproteobacteria bacterium]|nr:hypothetical protein [Gammaproteobacteria bacterium]
MSIFLLLGGDYVNTVELFYRQAVVGICAEKRRAIFPQMVRMPGLPGWAI